MNKPRFKIGDEVLVRGIVNSEETNGGIHVLHDVVDAFYQVSQIHQPQKVVIPQFVAEHIEYLRGLNSPMRDIFGCIDDKRLQDWLFRAPDADNTLARAWLDGYEVERERCFIVEIPDPEKPNGKKTNLAKFKGKVFLSSTMLPTPLTEAEIKRNHAWAWPFAREVLE